MELSNTGSRRPASTYLKFRLKNENIYDEQRINHTIQRMVPVDPVSECHALLDIIHKSGSGKYSPAPLPSPPLPVQ